MPALFHHPNRKGHNWLVYRILDQVLTNYRDLLRGTVVDLGCGQAPYKEYILKTADRYIGIDWADSLHDTKPDVTADLNKLLPVESATANTVISISVLEHLSEPQTMLNEAHRLLKPGGKLLLQVPWQWRIHEEPFDFFRYSPHGLKHLCEKAGFQKIEVKPMAGFFEMIALKLNYFSLRLARGPNWLQRGIRLLLWPFWQVSQVLSLMLGKLDRDPAAEAAGYVLVAERGV